MDTIKCDLLVAGAGISGICAAIAAARKGLSVVLVNDRSVLGGNASSEIGVIIHGSSHHGLNPAIYAKETGIVEEIRLRAAYYNQCGGYGFYSLLDAVFFDMIYNEKNIRLIMNTVVDGCEVKDGKILRAYARHSVSDKKYEIYADNYVDATGNGTLAYESGAEYRIGREGKSEFNEFWAPDKTDDFTMGNSIYFETEDAGHEVTFKAPEFAHDISNMEFLQDIDKPENFRGLSCYGPHWAYEFGGQLDILDEHDETELELRKLIYGIWDYIKNSGKYPEAKTRYLKRVFAKAGTRESRRFIGDYILNENDIENKVIFEDAVAIGGWPMDIHAPLGIYDSRPASNFVPVTGIYSIPFRCLYSKDIDNLMLAGRDISVTHIALGSTRVMGTCGAIGQAVGTAAYVCKKYNITPRELYKKHINELQSLLKDDDQTILHITNKSAINASVTASSVKKYENTSISKYIPLERDYALALALDSGYVESVKIKVKTSKKTTLKYKLLTGIHPETYLPEKLIKKAEIEINGNTDDWITVHIDEHCGADGKIYIVFERNNDIEIAVSEERALGAVTMRMHTEESHDGKNHDSVPLNAENTGYAYCDHCYEKESNICFKDITPAQSVYAPGNVLNGHARPYGVPNLWLADGKCMESLAIKPENEVSGFTVILNDNLDEDKFGEMPKSMAKELEIEVVYAKGSEKIEIKDNYRRMLKFSMISRDVKEIKITVKETYGERASIYSVSLW